jgi:PAS domain S-box-containing protein
MGVGSADSGQGPQSCPLVSFPQFDMNDLLLETGNVRKLYAIARELMDSRPLKDKLIHVVGHLGDPVDGPKPKNLWIEIDDRIYGSPPAHNPSNLFEVSIESEEVTRGRLCVAFSGDEDPRPEALPLFKDVADLIGLQLGISDTVSDLTESSRRYKKLAGNLAKEMWNRTEALAKETGYLEGILRSSEDIIITTDLDSCIVEFNTGAEKILGYSAEDMYGRDITELWENAEERNQIMEKVHALGGVRNHQTRLKKKSGELIEISLTLSKLVDGEGRVLGTVGVSKDISREQAVKRELERLNQNYRETINFISHESKNSLLVIGGFVRRLMDEEDDSRKKSQLEIVYHHSKFLEAMSRDFLVMAELEQGGDQCRKEQIEDFFEEVIYPAMTGLKERYPDSFDSYDSTKSDFGAVRLMGNRDLLEIVYRNLIGNALKYRSPGGKIAFGVEEQPNGYRLNVWNEGPGIPKGEAERVFEKFYRIRDNSNRGKRGTGLGLYNIRWILQAHGGNIWCETEPGAWINFVFDIPKE